MCEILVYQRKSPYLLYKMFLKIAFDISKKIRQYWPLQAYLLVIWNFKFNVFLFFSKS